MKYLTPFLTSLLLMLGLLSSAHAGSANLCIDPSAIQQSDTPGDEDGKKKIEGEEEEPDCD